MARAKQSTNEMITDRMIGTLKSGVNPWARNWWRPGGQPNANLESGHVYQGYNVIATGLAGFKSPWWVTYKQAKSLGGQVLKGQQGTKIIRWIQFEKKDASGNKTGEDGYGFLKTFTIFNIEQCEGLLAPASEDKPDAKHDALGSAEALLAGYLKRGPEIVEASDPTYVPSGDKVKIPSISVFKTPEDYYCALFHEVIHSTGHRKRLDREGITNPATFKTHEQYGFEELVAELGSCFLRSTAGIEVESTFNNSAAYLGHWIKKLESDTTLLIKAARAAQTAADKVMGITRVYVAKTAESKAA